MMKAKWIFLVLMFAAAFVIFFNERFIRLKAIAYLAKHTYLETTLLNSTIFPYITATVQPITNPVYSTPEHALLQHVTESITKSVLSTTEHSLPQNMTESITKSVPSTTEHSLLQYRTKSITKSVLPTREHSLPQNMTESITKSVPSTTEHSLLQYRTKSITKSVLPTREHSLPQNMTESITKSVPSTTEHSLLQYRTKSITKSVLPTREHSLPQNMTESITKSVLSTTEHALPQYMTKSIRKIYAQSWNKVITPYITKYVIDGHDYCNVSSPPSVLIFVLSLPKNTMERQAIRHTWGSVLNQSRPVFNISAKIVFMLGMMVDETKFDKVLQEESTAYKDIVQFNLTESRYNLTRKMINGLRWIKTYCRSVKYILKTDDDTFINVERFSNYLFTNPNINTRTIHGYLYGNGGAVLRVGKYAVKEEELPSSFYPPYVSGTAYILPFDVISDMLRLVERLPYCPVDDAFMTGVLRVILDIKIRHSGSFTHVSETKLSPCQFNSKIAVTNINIKCMDMLWYLTTRTGGVDCKQSIFYDKQICPIFG
ncbi:hypothetical protein CHS0354_005382 [Potamilus streckersoni]|uniref:Hexosyltransferase n=1 Tax=Potamilus streckersoni TaxID=2493646 RepID=A0AAE0SJE2_9BIVA|nr:hypothetical protein CHS0354_005382 [Potamilus streckersoni]